MQEGFWMDYKEKMGEIKQLLLQQYSNLDEKMNQKESLILVDAIQRVGLDHHFDEEIEMILERHSSNSNFGFIYDDLYNVSLQFRLLRNQGHYVSPGMYITINVSDTYLHNFSRL